jgi:hypothetical protein
MKASWVGVLLVSSLLATVANGQSAAEVQTFAFNSAYQFAGKADAEFAGTTRDGVTSSEWKLEAQIFCAGPSSLRDSAAVGFAMLQTDAPAAVPIPKRLQSFFVDLATTWKINHAWELVGDVDPGVYTDSKASSREGWAVPATVYALWRSDVGWTLGAGTRVAPFAQHKVMPIAFARWQIRRHWLLEMGARTEVEYETDGDLPSIAAFAEWQESGYAVNDPAVVPPAGYPDLRDTRVDHREIHTGLSLFRQVTPHLKLQVEGGVLFGQRFDYYDRNLTVTLGSAAFGSVALTAGF